MGKKEEGQYMTPNGITTIILDAIGYKGTRILTKKVMEPSFGEGVFLLEAIERVIHVAQAQGKTEDEVVNILTANIFGIEKDKSLYDTAIKKINALLVALGVRAIDWSNNLINGDTLTLYTRYIGQMDFVIGNPPYVDPEHMDKDVLEFIKTTFDSCQGKTDLSIAFYDMGIQMLNDTGRLGFISPNSFMKNASQSAFRGYLVNEKYISKIYDFRTSKIFADADTYTCICILDKNKKRISDDVEYREYNMYDIVVQSKLSWDYFLNQLKDKPWNLASDAEIKFLEQNKAEPIKIKNIATVQNGIATNRDKVYVHKVYNSDGSLYNGKHTDKKKIVYLDGGNENGGIQIESTILHRCVKASKYDGIMDNTYIIFPYKACKKPKITSSISNKVLETGYTPISEQELKEKYPKAYSYLEGQYDDLQTRDMENTDAWYQFGRSQGLVNSCLKKIVFKHIIERDNPVIVPYVLDEDVIVYSGIYTTLDITGLITKAKSGYTLNEFMYNTMMTELLSIFRDENFAKYLSIVGKDMQGGYIAFSTKHIKEYGTELTGFPNFPVEIPKEDLNIADNNYLNKLFQTQFINCVKEAYENIGIQGATSSERVKPFHSFLAKVLQFKLGPDYEVQSAGYGFDKEFSLNGVYNEKNTDVCVIKHGNAVGAIEFKLMSNNFKQNLGNYKEGLLGEAAQMHGMGIRYGFCYMIPEKALYLTKDGRFSKYDVLTQKDIEPFYRMMVDDMEQQAPDALFVGVHELFTETYLNSLHEGDKVEFDSAEYQNAIAPSWSTYDFVSDEDVKETMQSQNIGEFLDDFIESIKKMIG